MSDSDFVVEKVPPTFFKNDAPIYLKLALYLLVGFHMAVLLGNIIAIFILPFVVSWYISLPLVSLLINFMFSAVACPLTRLESVIRRNMGLPEIRYFVQHYFWRQSIRKRMDCR